MSISPGISPNLSLWNNFRQAEAFLIELGCPKVSFCVRKDNDAVLAFYDGLGYGMDDVHFLGKRLIPDE